MGSTKLLHLQGLRAVAILAVLFFHYFPKYCPNGYLGVDQFFLLSGYLMTMMLERNKELSFSGVVDFFYRRVKRIVPLYYLATLFITLSINISPQMAVQTNVESSVKAIAFATNLIRPDGLEDYNARLGLGVDMFTHTWSLAAEMQFYFIFPFIFIIYVKTSSSSKSFFMYALVLCSLVFHITSDSFLSFYCVFARIWQFLAGMFIYYENSKVAKTKAGYKALPTASSLEENLSKSLLDDQKAIEESAVIKTDDSLQKLVVNSCLVCLFCLFATRTPIDPFIGRVVTIVMTSLIVHVGDISRFLSNKCLVFIGEISFSWYLIHWPVVAWLKMNSLTTNTDMLCGLIVSLLFSILVYFTFEKWYLSWNKTRTILAVGLLLLLNGAAIFQASLRIPKSDIREEIAKPANITIHVDSSLRPFIYESDFLNKLEYGYENKTNEERAALNSAMSANDAKQAKSYPCVKQKTATSREQRCQVQKDFKEASTNMTLLVIGNSYVGNAMKTIYEQCKDVFPNIYSTWTGSCEPLVRGYLVTGVDCSYDDFFMDAVKLYKPDVVFIVNRFMDSTQIHNGTNPFNDDIFKMMVKRLKELEKHVTHRIYMLNSFFWPNGSLNTKLNKFLKTGVKFKDEDLLQMGKRQWFDIGRKRMDRLAAHCEKCRLFDYTSQFFIDGKMHYYDPKYFVSYFVSSLHLTPVGLARVAPLYNQICHTLNE